MEKYETLYNKALERADAIYNGKYKPEIAAWAKENLEAIFPELAEKKEPKKIEENSFESDIVVKALRKVGYEWSEDTHELKKIEPKFKVGEGAVV